MSARRLESGGAIERDRPIEFTFEGRHLSGFAGDTLASALLANGVRIVGRSFKYHRPRGVWGAWVEEPNALVDVTHGEWHRPNLRATTVWLAETPGLSAKAVNAEPDVERDRYALLDRFARFIPAAFYYKTFVWPDWHRYEPAIRRAAGLGRIDPRHAPPAATAQITVGCDLLVVGAGPAGLACARAAASVGLSVILADDRPTPGGSLGHRGGEIEGRPATDWSDTLARELDEAGVRRLANTTAYGVYDHNLAGLTERDGETERLWRVRADRIVLAAGAIERPLVFDDNDRPGVMSADAALAYLHRHAVLVGRRIAVATNNDSAYETAMAAARAGAEVTVIDARHESAAMARAEAVGLRILRGHRPAGVDGARGVESVRAVALDGGATARLPAEVLAVSGGWTPSVHLYCQARGKLAWNEELAAFVPGAPLPGLSVAGAACGAMTLDGALAEGHGAGVAAAAAAGRTVTLEAPRCTAGGEGLAVRAVWPQPGARGRAWVDLQNDVTVKDVELAARENYRSVEHLKRYTTLGMATDQGKTSNLNGLALMAAISGRSIPEVGTTTYRPPYTPVPLTAFGGTRRGQLMAPVRRLPLEPEHRAEGAVFREYGGWLRPAFYGDKADPRTAIRREAGAARESVAIFDATPLGKIEVIGPDAAALVDFNYYNTMATLKTGRVRYGLMLQESGVVYDDGVLMRLADDRFVVSCSSSHVDGVYARLEEWRQDSFDRQRVFVHDATPAWATLTATGPRAKALVERLGLGVDLDDDALPHMALAHGRFGDAPARVARVSFTGDRSYEISVPPSKARALWRRMKTEGEALEATLLGIEALSVLRAEKGFIMIGKDSDGATMPHDLGMAGPRDKRKTEFVGRRSLFTEEAERENRRQLIGLVVPEGAPALPVGAHGVESGGDATRSIGYVTSSVDSPALGRPIALALIERGRARIGEEIAVQHLGERRTATIAPACAFDPAGARLYA